MQDVLRLLPPFLLLLLPLLLIVCKSTTFVLPLLAIFLLLLPPLLLLLLLMDIQVPGPREPEGVTAWGDEIQKTTAEVAVSGAEANHAQDVQNESAAAYTRCLTEK